MACVTFNSRFNIPRNIQHKSFYFKFFTGIPCLRSRLWSLRNFWIVFFFYLNIYRIFNVQCMDKICIWFLFGWCFKYVDKMIVFYSEDEYIGNRIYLMLFTVVTQFTKCLRDDNVTIRQLFDSVALYLSFLFDWYIYIDPMQICDSFLLNNWSIHF